MRNLLEVPSNRGAVNHVTGDVHFLTLALPKRRTILTIHDCEILYRLKGWRRRVVFWGWFKLPAWRSGTLTTISDFSAEELVKWLGPGIRNRLHVIPVCLTPGFAPALARPMPQCPRILAFGGAPNKNIVRLAAALEGFDCELNLIGKPRAEHAAAMARHRIRCRMEHGLSDGQIRERYAECDLLAFPSTGEGFGMPIIEAQAAGRPVITSDRSPMREVAGGAACLVDPEDPPAIRRGIERVVRDAAYRENLVRRGMANAQRYDPAEIAECYAALYREVAAR